uniref:Interleukin 17C n=1 Tax=Calidris pygmaea TaxID=425635 RepID=A0A8C3PMY4_9CHAR
VPQFPQASLPCSFLDENRYPRKLAFAECLCSGCVDVKTGRETTSLNSVAIHQTMMVLRRKPCPRPVGPGFVTFEVDYIKVPVGCTCVLPRTAVTVSLQPPPHPCLF